jgi:hypothetical protein
MATIEVRELVIRATIVPEGSASQASAASAMANNNGSPTEELINTCVEKVLEIIRDKNVR